MPDVDMAHVAALLGLLAGGVMVGGGINAAIEWLPDALERHWRREAASEVGVPEESGASGRRRPPAWPQCPACGAAPAPLDAIPLIGWAHRRGRCGACAARTPLRRPLVEALGGSAAVAAVLAFGWTWPALAACAALWSLTALACIDLERKLLPDLITLPLLWGGLLANVGGDFAPLQSAVIGAAAGYLCLWVPTTVFELISGREGMGGGDFKLNAAIGAWLGWEALPFTVAAAAALSILHPLATGRAWDDPRPFGPYLAAAGVAVAAFRL